MDLDFDFGSVNWFAFVPLAIVGVVIVSIATRRASLLVKILGVAISVIGAFFFASRMSN